MFYLGMSLGRSKSGLTDAAHRFLGQISVKADMAPSDVHVTLEQYALQKPTWIFFRLVSSQEAQGNSSAHTRDYFLRIIKSEDLHQPKGE